MHPLYWCPIALGMWCIRQGCGRYVDAIDKNLGMSTREKRDDGHLSRSRDLTPMSYTEVLPNRGHRHSLKYFLDDRLPSLEKHR